MTGALTWARFSFRLQRLEILILSAAVLAASALMVWWAFELVGLSEAYPECDFFGNDSDFSGGGSACQAPTEQFFGIRASAEMLISNVWLAGLVAGLVLGVPLVAREVEGGTAQLAWTIGRSRVRWFVGRVAFAALVASLLLAVIAVVTEILASAAAPGFDMSRDFTLYGARGPLVVARGFLGLGVGVVVGAVLGRQLPALLVGLILIGLLYAAIAFGMGRWNETEGILGPRDQNARGALYVGAGLELETGERISWGDARARDLSPEMIEGIDGRMYASQADAEAGRNAIGRRYELIIPGERYPEIVAREAAVTVGLGAVLLLTALLVTQRRRPR